ncbi:hypothetical protein WB334_25700, partial [Escherichia coli]|uniref:hypothetical protein n=1 Tax=Escherichia coli TaxID=562 RepID=UPI002157BB59
PVTSTSIPWPPLNGSGSDREAWIAFAREVAKGNEEAWEVVDEQAARIASLEAEVAQLRDKLAERAPSEAQPDTPGPSTLEPADRQRADDRSRTSRRMTSEDTKAAIRADLAAGLSQSEAARRNGVSAMTVSRLVRSA